MKKRALLSEHKVYSNEWINVLQKNFKVGEQKKIYTSIKRSNSVIAIPITRDGKTVLLKQFRYPTEKESLEFPMGGINEGERAIEALKRELKEEIGIDAITLEEIGKFHPVPGLTDQIVYVFLVYIDDLSMIQVNASEDIDGSMIIPLDDVFHLIQKGQITDGFTLAAALFIKLYNMKYNSKQTAFGKISFSAK